MTRVPKGLKELYEAPGSFAAEHKILYRINNSFRIIRRGKPTLLALTERVFWGGVRLSQLFRRIWNVMGCTSWRIYYHIRRRSHLHPNSVSFSCSGRKPEPTMTIDWFNLLWMILDSISAWDLMLKKYTKGFVILRGFFRWFSSSQSHLYRGNKGFQ